jgi:hypothetical protein
MMTTSRHVGAANCLICAWEMRIERFGEVIAGDDHKSYLMTRCHDAEAAGFQIECTRLAHTGQRMNNDHHFPLEALPAFRRVDGNAREFPIESQRHCSVHDVVCRAHADVCWLQAFTPAVHYEVRLSVK